MPEFKDLIKDLYTTKGRELTEEKLNYIEKEYGGGKEEEFIKDFYATIGEDLTKDKFDYIRTEYLKKKEPIGGLLMQKTSANAPQFFGEPSVPTSGAPLESKSKLPSTQKIEPFTGKVAPVKPLSGDMPEAAYQNIQAKKEADINKEFRRQKYENQRYYRVKDKLDAKNAGYDDIKGYYKDRSADIVQNYLNYDEQNEVLSYQKFIDAKNRGDEKLAQQELSSYLDARSKFREKINSQINEIKDEKIAVTRAASWEDASPEFRASIQKSLDKKIENLELAKKPFYDPKSQMDDFIVENKTEIAAVSKPTQTAKEKLEEYVNAQFTKVNDIRKDLGIATSTNLDTYTIGDYANDWKLEQQGRGDELETLYNEERKLRTAAKLLYLNRTPIDESETALSVGAKSFINNLVPKSKSEVATNQVLSNNIKEIVEDAKLGGSVYKEQMNFAEEEAKPYKPYSANWFAEPIGGSAAFMVEFVPASILTEGGFALTKLGRVINAYEKLKRGGVTIKTGAKYFDIIQKTKVGRGLLNAGASGLKGGVTSKTVSELFPTQEDEVNFTTGLVGNGMGSVANKLFGAAGELPVKMMQRLFGNNATAATKVITGFGEKINSLAQANKDVVVGELFQETGETLGQLWQQSDSGQDFMAKVKEQFGDLDNATQFVVQTLVMAAGMGHGTSLGKAYFNQGKELYNALPRKSRAKVDEVMNEIKKEEDEINDKIADEVKNEQNITEQEIKQSAPTMTQQDFEDKLDLIEDEKNNKLAEYEGSLEEQYSIGGKETIRERIESDYNKQKEELTKEYERAKEPITGATDVTQEGLGVATETGTQGVTRTNIPAEKVAPASKEQIESTAKALEGEITFEGKRGQANSITYNGKTIKQGEEIELDNVNISQDDSMPDFRSGKYKVRMLSVNVNGKNSTLTLTDGNEVITTTVKDLRKAQAEAYHKAKADGSNPELVKAVEELLGKPEAKAEKAFTYDKDGNIIEAEILSRGKDTSSILINGKQTVRANTELFNNKESAQKRIESEEKVITPEQEKEIELLDLEKKIAQLEKDLRTAPVKPRRGVSSQKQIRIQIRNYKEQLRELKGLPPKKKPTDSVLRINLRAFSAQVDENNLPHGERVVLDAIGRLSATDKDIVNLDGNAKLRNQTVLKTKGGLSLDQIVTDYISENDLDPDMASDLRDDIIAFVSGGDVYKWLDRIREREAQVDPDAIAEDSYYNYGYQMAEELELTDEEISELEYEIGQLTDLTQEEYEKLKQQFAEESDTRTGEGVNIVEGKADISEAQTEEKLTKEQRKEIAAAKIDDVAQALKGLLPKIEGEKLGLGQDEVIELIAKAVKALVNTGIEIDEAIKRVKEKLAESFNGVDAIDDNEIKAKISVTESITPKSRDEQNQKAKSYGYKNAPHALRSVNKEKGTSYERFSDIPTDVLEEVAVAKGLTEVSENAEKVISDIDKVMMGEENPNKMAKSLIAGLKRSEKYTEADKERITEKVGEFYLTQSVEKLKEIGQAFIDELGGLDKAVSEAMLKNSTLPPTVRIFILGQGILNARAMQDRATNKAQKDKLADYQTDMFDVMDNLVRDYGRAINYVKEFYKPSALAAARKEKKNIDEINRLRNNQVNKSAKAVKDIVEDKTDVTESVNEAVEDVLEGSKETIEALQKEIDALRKQIAGGRKGSKSNPINLGVTKEQVKDARKRLLGLTYANAPLNPEFWRDMGILAADAIQEGFRKMGDFYEYMRKSLNGKYSDSYGEVYLKARDKAIESGAKESDFSTDDEVQAELDRIQKETDAEKIARLTAAKAKAEAKKAKKETDASKIAAKKIISDAQKELNNVTTKKEQDAVNKIINIVAKKAKELSKSQNKPTGNSIADLVMFAFQQADNGLKIWNEAQKEVYSMIEKDTEITKEEKEALVDFLDKYKDGVFDILLTKGQKDRIIKEKLIEAGYATEKGGKIVLDLEPIIAKAKTIDEAVSSITKAISKETGLSESELADFTKAIKTRLTDIVAEKKAKRIENYLKRNERRIATALSSGRKRKTQVQKLLELYNAGGLSDRRVKEILAKELGIIYFTAEDEAFLEKKFEELDKAPIGGEAEKIEEEIQAYIETKSKGLFSKALYERTRSRLLSSPLTFIKNLSGFLDTFVMGIQQLIVANRGIINPKNWKDGKFDTNTLKVLGNSIEYALNTAMDIMINGGVDLGTAFSESTGTKEGTPRVRYLEYNKNTIPDLYVFMGGKKINLNLYNRALKGEKYVGRGLSFADTWNQIMLQEMKTYNYIKSKLMASDPTLTDRQASQKAYDTMYALDIEKATAEVAKEFETRGITLDMNKKSDRYRFFRRVYEKVSQSRGEEVVKAASEFASRYTYKQSDAGIMTPIKYLLTQLKLIFNTAASKLRAEGKKKENENMYNMYESLAKSMEAIGEGVFTTYQPFIQGVANILEKGLELYPPYGLAKATSYLTVGALLKDKNAGSKLYGKSGEFFIRALIGLAVIEMFKSLADDDEDDGKPAIYGAGEEDYRKGQAIKTLRPPNTIVIDGRPINLDYLGSFGVALKVEAALLDLERYDEKYQKLDPSEKEAVQALSVANSILVGSYTQGLADLVAGKLNGMARAAELATRLMIPYTNAVRQGYQLIDPKAKKPISFMENMAKYSGLVAGWSLDRPAFDYRGREYKTGQLYTGSPSGFIGMFSVMDKLADDYDKIILKSTNYDMAFTGFERENPKYYVVDSETGKERQMTDEEYYNVMFEKNKMFDSLVKESLSDPISGNDLKTDMLSDSKYAKKIIGRLNSIAKKEAFEKVFGEVPIYVEEELSVYE